MRLWSLYSLGSIPVDITRLLLIWFLGGVKAKKQGRPPKEFLDSAIYKPAFSEQIKAVMEESDKDE